MKEFIQMIENIRNINKCDCVDVYANPMVIQTVIHKLINCPNTGCIIFHEAPSYDTNTIYVLPHRPQPIHYTTEHKEKIYFKE